MREHLAHHRTHRGRTLGPKPEHAGRVRDPCEVRVDQADAGSEESGRFMLELDEPERAVVEDDYLDGKAELPLQSEKTRSGCVSWKYSDPISELGICAAIANAGARLRWAS
jgi:hypothetical protein